VLRVSAAVEFRHQGKTIMEATILAGEQRLRPIIMTSLAFAMGCLPLALALGAGANARHSIGTGIIGGMIGETTLAMLYVPLLFYLFDRMAEGGDEKADAHPPAPAAPHAGAAAGGRRQSSPARRRLAWAAAARSQSLPLSRRCRPARWDRTTCARLWMRPALSASSPRSSRKRPIRRGGNSSATRCSTS
jgi:hypothetical protein